MAIPHGTNEAKLSIRSTGRSFIRYPDGIDWNGDGELGHYVVGIAGAGDDHLTLLGSIAHVFLDDEKVRCALAAATHQGRGHRAVPWTASPWPDRDSRRPGGGIRATHAADRDKNDEQASTNASFWCATTPLRAAAAGPRRPGPGDRGRAVRGVRDCQRGWQTVCPTQKAVGYHSDGGLAQYIVIPEEVLKVDVSAGSRTTSPSPRPRSPSRSPAPSTPRSWERRRGGCRRGRGCGADRVHPRGFGARTGGSRRVPGRAVPGAPGPLRRAGEARCGHLRGRGRPGGGGAAPPTRTSRTTAS